MSTLRYDKHTFYCDCRGMQCDLVNRCDECKEWPEEQVNDLLKHLKGLESKCKIKAIKGCCCKERRLLQL